MRNRLLPQTQPAQFTEIRLSRSALLHNLRMLQEAAGSPVVPMLKSRAYGHGLLEVAAVIDAERPPFIGVYSVEEAAGLRRAGVNSKCLLFGPAPDVFFQKKMLGISSFSLMSQKLELVASSLEYLRMLVRSGIRAEVHLFVDTGLGREGVLPSQLREALKLVEGSTLNMSGLMTHLADADRQAGKAATAHQRELFIQIYGIVRSAGFSPYWLHTDGTSGLSSKGLFAGDQVTTLSRAGLGLYGYLSSDWRLFSRQARRVRPVAEYWTQIIQVKTLPSGSSVGYGHTYTTKKEERVGLLPIGYADGLPRELSNKGVVRLMVNKSANSEAKFYSVPIIGRVSMNQTVIRLPPQLGKYASVASGLPVQLISRDPRHANSMREIAKRTKLLIYNVMTNLPAETARVIED